VTALGRRVVGVDLGARRIGLACTDLSGVLASPLRTIERGASTADDHRTIVEAACEAGAATLVVGVPRSLSGGLGPAARQVLEEIDDLRQAALPAGIEVDTYDERFTTMIATRRLRDAGRAGRRATSRRRKGGEVDAAAAAEILQGWLDAQGATPA
jgi:putative Holliday junction resolvase